ncbi:hypothetical protein GV64_07570 [Endozoicomonas elysicola]|uniref:Uncharacterized protein n=1 Tax=Endozoicomonas elysicola TaxID=305900 RepID=A0A081K8Z1_9GAMM|nr:hypothetical protein GV64_07570 [Endozoicomonas elysicola]
MVLSGMFLVIMLLHLMVAMLIVFVSLFMGLMRVFMPLWVATVLGVRMAFFMLTIFQMITVVFIFNLRVILGRAL